MDPLMDKETLAREIAGELMQTFGEVIDIPLDELKSILTEHGWNKDKAVRYCQSMDLIANRAFLLRMKVGQTFGLK